MSRTQAAQLAAENWGFGFRVSGFGFRVLGLGFRVHLAGENWVAPIHGDAIEVVANQKRLEERGLGVRTPVSLSLYL
jgi:hypothetical protein